MLEPLSWIAQNHAATGSWVDLSLPELGISGYAQVMNVLACPVIESGYGRVILGTFQHVSHEVYHLRLAGQADPIGVTYGHPIWSVDRGDWVKAGELRVGEHVATEKGCSVVESVTPDPTPQMVYNLDVETDHRYLVTDAAVVVHNADTCITVKRFGHTFKIHGEGSENANFLRHKAAATGQSQGQWINNQAAANYLDGQILPPGYGTRVITIPEGLGQVIMPDGSIVSAVRAILVPGGGGVRTAYPII